MGMQSGVSWLRYNHQVISEGLCEEASTAPMTFDPGPQCPGVMQLRSICLGSKLIFILS